MDDYTDLIEYLHEMHDVMLYDDSIESEIPEEMITDIDAIACKEAADVIEQLLKERDAAITDFTIYVKHMEDSRKAFSCEFCNEENCDGCKHCSNFVWRGVQEDNND